MRVRLICLVASQRVLEEQPLFFLSCSRQRRLLVYKMSAPDAEEAREEPQPLTADAIRALIREELAAAITGPPRTSTGARRGRSTAPLG